MNDTDRPASAPPAAARPVSPAPVSPTAKPVSAFRAEPHALQAAEGVRALAGMLAGAIPMLLPGQPRPALHRTAESDTSTPHLDATSTTAVDAHTDAGEGRVHFELGAGGDSAPAIVIEAPSVAPKRQSRKLSKKERKDLMVKHGFDAGPLCVHGDIHRSDTWQGGAPAPAARPGSSIACVWLLC